LGWGASNQYKGKANLAASHNDAVVLWLGMEGCQMTKDEELALALEVLATEEYRLRQTGQSQVYPGIGFAITAIKQARLAPVQEPWKYRRWDDAKEQWELTDDSGWPSEPVYTAPPAAQRQWVGLTPEKIDELMYRFTGYELLYAIQAELKENNA
jgi:hypothetical protein